jgi:hypothetical protein
MLQLLWLAQRNLSQYHAFSQILYWSSSLLSHSVLLLGSSILQTKHNLQSTVLLQAHKINMDLRLTLPYPPCLWYHSVLTQGSTGQKPRNIYVQIYSTSYNCMAGIIALHHTFFKRPSSSMCSVITKGKVLHFSLTRCYCFYSSWKFNSAKTGEVQKTKRMGKALAHIVTVGPRIQSS